MGILTGVSQNSALPVWRRTEADFWRAYMRVMNRTQDLPDAEATRILVQISLNLQAPAWMRTKAAYCQGYMRVQNRTQDLTDAEAMKLLAQLRSKERPLERLG